jgi:hypothetical protein
MKKIVFTFLFFYGALFAVNCSAQVKITKATTQKTGGGIGGIFINYTIEFKNKASVPVEADSVKSFADSSMLDFNFRKNENGFYEITFRQALVKPEKCKTCRDITPKNSNLTKGVIVYCKRGERSFVFKAKKFRQLADLNMP